MYIILQPIILPRLTLNIWQLFLKVVLHSVYVSLRIPALSVFEPLGHLQLKHWHRTVAHSSEPRYRQFRFR